MKKGKKVTWNAGQVPERLIKPRLPHYFPAPDIIENENRDAWHRLDVGQMLLAIKPHSANVSVSKRDLFPYPVMYPYASGRYYPEDVQVDEGQVMVYLGITNVDCLGAKGRIISKPYPMVFFRGSRYLIHDQNYLKPLA